MIEIIFNGEAKSIQPQTVSSFLTEMNVADSACALAINESFIPKNEYVTTELNHGDRIELLVPMQGG